MEAQVVVFQDETRLVGMIDNIGIMKPILIVVIMMKMMIMRMHSFLRLKRHSKQLGFAGGVVVFASGFFHYGYGAFCRTCYLLAIISIMIMTRIWSYSYKVVDGGVMRRRREERRRRSNRLNVVLNEVNDVVVEFLHVSKLRHQHVVAPSKSLVVLRQRGHSG